MQNKQEILSQFELPKLEVLTDAEILHRAELELSRLAIFELEDIPCADWIKLLCIEYARGERPESELAYNHAERHKARCLAKLEQLAKFGLSYRDLVTGL